MQRDSSTYQHSFLSTLMEGIPPGSFFHVAKAVGDGFHNEPWREQLLEGPWYFFTGASVNRKHRRRQDLVAVRAIVIDDVGTKVDGDRLKTQPTWIIETSPGNHQWGYMLKAWDPDIPKADALFKALVEAGLQDKGVNTACRLFRIPGSVNLKKGRDNFEAKLVHFDHERVYTLTSLAKALGVRPGDPIEPRVDSGERPGAGKPDPFFDWLLERGMVRQEASGGWWLIDCPWPEEHTEGRSEAKYLPSWASEDGEPGVMCHHGHGEPRAEYRKRFFEWAAGEGAPTGRTNWADLRKMFQAIRTDPGATRFIADITPDTGSLYNFTTLVEAIGPIPPVCFPHCAMTASGKPQPKQTQPCTINNVEAGLAHLGIQARLNLMNAATSYVLPDRIDVRRFGAKPQYQIDEMVSWALRAVFNKAGIANEQKLEACLAGLANASYWHPAKDWITSKPWDGQDRLEALLGSVKAADPRLFKTYFRRWALQTIEAACGWAVRPEQEKAICLVLAGKQGIGKSRWLASLAPGYFAGGKHLSLDGSVSGSRDSIHQALQGMIVELGELDTTFGKSAAGSLKAFLSTYTDEYRLPYAAGWLKRPRCTSFAASVNDDKFLQDHSGSRRFAVAWVDHCEPLHATDMQQFWAQMHHHWQAGEPFYFTPEETQVQTISNETFQAIDAVFEAVAEEADRRREASDTYTVEGSLGVIGVAALLSRYMPVSADKGTYGRIRKAMEKHWGKSKDQRNRGGVPDGWIVWLSGADVALLKPKVLRPAK